MDADDIVIIDVGGLDFEPEPVEKWEPPGEKEGGIYVIMDRDLESDEYGILYIGEAEEFSKCKFDKGHPRYNCWKDETREDLDDAGGPVVPGEDDIVLNLFVATLRVDDADLRRHIKRRLVETVDPPCK